MAQDDYPKIEKAINFLEANFKSQPSLDQIAASVHLSQYHFDRLFKKWAGISPIQFLQFLTLEYAKQKLAESRSLLDTSLAAGLSGPGRLHDLFVTFEAMTPGVYKQKGAGMEISHGVFQTPFGACCMATTPRGICHLGFLQSTQRDAVLSDLHEMWPAARFVENPQMIAPLAAQIFESRSDHRSRPLHLYLKGTNFQINVWKALLRIPEGWVVSYQDIARLIGKPTAFRAVASAIAVNPVAVLIPCHRVIAKSGKLHHYRWGSARKKALFGWEAANRLRANE